MIENFAPNLIRLRKNKGLSQKELAKKLGMSSQTISNIEKQGTYPTFNNLEKIAQFFNASPTDLFGTSREIELEKSVLETDEYVEKATYIINAIKKFDSLTAQISNLNSLESYTSDTINNLMSLLTPKPIVDRQSDEQLVRHIQSGQLLRAEDQTGNPLEYEPAYNPSPLSEALNKIDEINDLYEKVRFIDSFNQSEK